jgi:O-antigen chain-terminating methyltransferase
MDLFYKRFEDVFRGSRALIKQRLCYYLPLIQGLKLNFNTLTILDLGCGRGEWLELLKEHDIYAQGVDSDEGMLSACRGLDLDCTHGDVIDFLKSQSDACCEVITSLHLIEHLPFDVLKELVFECFRILKPGGVLILETPNCENIIVGSGSFYLDPTHIKPLPSQLISFLTLFCGFKKSDIHFLTLPWANLNDIQPSLVKIFHGVGGDYAVIAQKDGNDDALQLLENYTSQNPKKNLHDLIQEYDDRILKIEKSIEMLLKIFCIKPLVKAYKKLKYIVHQYR